MVLCSNTSPASLRHVQQHLRGVTDALSPVKVVVGSILVLCDTVSHGALLPPRCRFCGHGTPVAKRVSPNVGFSQRPRNTTQTRTRDASRGMRRRRRCLEQRHVCDPVPANQEPSRLVVTVPKVCITPQSLSFSHETSRKEHSLQATPMPMLSYIGPPTAQDTPAPRLKRRCDALAMRCGCHHASYPLTAESGTSAERPLPRLGWHHLVRSGKAMGTSPGARGLRDNDKRERNAGGVG